MPRELSSTRVEMWREATIMMLYVCVVEIAELAAIPETHFADGRVTGPTHGELIAIVWGTAAGLAIAHWFAFNVAAPAFRGGTPSRLEALVGLGQLAGAAFVAALCTLPVLLLSSVRAQESIGDVPAAVLGAIGYLLARRAGNPRIAALAYGVLALALGVLVAAVKSALAAH